MEVPFVKRSDNALPLDRYHSRPRAAGIAMAETHHRTRNRARTRTRNRVLTRRPARRLRARARARVRLGFQRRRTLVPSRRLIRHSLTRLPWAVEKIRRLAKRARPGLANRAG